MDTEIELKYLVHEDNIVERITELFKQQNVEFQYSQKQLDNCYFDTHQNDFRQLDMGLRVRTSSSGYIEQTIKTAGKVLAGLHQRPEYNVKIDEPFPELVLFPQDIWPQGANVLDFQENLVSLFSTNFTRSTWVVSLSEDDIIELAYDSGEILAKGQSEVINEIELELLKGDPESLLKLARLLASALSMRPGIHSKAARGYALAKGVAPSVKADAKLLAPIEPSLSLNHAVVVGFQYGLTQLQARIDHFLTEKSLVSLRAVVDGLAFIRHGLWLFKAFIPEQSAQTIRLHISTLLNELIWVESAKQLKQLTSKSGNYRKKLDYSKDLLKQLKTEKETFPTCDDVAPLFFSREATELQLDILALIFNELVDAKRSEALDEPCQSLVEFADKSQQQSMIDVFEVFPQAQPLTAKQYISNHMHLTRSLLTGEWVGNLYDDDERAEFRNSWLDVQQGIEELETLSIISEQLKYVELEQGDQSKLLRWLDGKVDSLVQVMEQSREMAMRSSPYWQH